ncbi:MAG: hypothetical protein JWQ84_2550 [Mucilaginibacter sp.]|nr:hypothetical protein [Mucilaginibacter sp.]
MRQFLLKYTNNTLLAIIILLVIFRVCSLHKQHFDDTDVVNREIDPFKKYFTPGNNIGFDDRTENAGLYMTMEYVVAPRIISGRSNTDTVILTETKGDKLINIPNYRTIAKSEYDNRIISLITKVK